MIRPTSRKSSVVEAAHRRRLACRRGRRTRSSAVARRTGRCCGSSSAPTVVQPLLGVLPRPLGGAQVELEQVRVGAAGEEVDTAGEERRRRGRRRSRAPAAGTRGTPRSPAIRKHVALAAITCSSGPPCIPGKTARSIACACSSRQRTNPARGPASVLCVVEVTTSQSLDRVRMQTGGDEPGEVRHVAPEQRADLVGDPPEHRRVDRARVGASRRRG